MFEMLVRKLTSETLTSDKTIALDIIKKYFGKNTELAKELQLYNSVLKEQHKSEARALDYIAEAQKAYRKLNQSTLRRQKYNLVKEIQENFSFDSLANARIPNYKVLASTYLLFEYADQASVKQLAQCKDVILEHTLKDSVKQTETDELYEEFRKQTKDTRLLTYKLLVDKFNNKYTNLSEAQKNLLKQYITHVNDTDSLKSYIKAEIPKIKQQLKEHVAKTADDVARIKIENLAEMLCNVENMKVIKESHVLSLLRYFDLVDELNRVHQ